MSIWLDECDPEELRAKSPHQVCEVRDEHPAHAWRGIASAYDGAVEIWRTFWCEGTGEP